MDGEAMREFRLRLGAASAGSGSSLPQRRAHTDRRVSVTAILALCFSPGVATAQAPSPSAPWSLVARPMLAASVAWPTGSLPRIEPSGPPSAEATAEGIHLALWLPDDPVPAGDWVPATVIATNVGEVPITLSQDATGEPGCGPFRIALESAGLFGDALPAVEGNAGIFLERLFRAGPFSQRMIDWNDGQAYPCQDQLVEVDLAPGESLEARVGAPAIHEWRSQPLPGGTTTVVVGMSFDRATSKSAESHEFGIGVSGDVAIAGDPPAFAGPGAFAATLLDDEAFAAWLETRDLDRDWTVGLRAPELTSEDSPAFPGGPAPIDPVEAEVSADGAGPSSSFQMSLDAWTGQRLEYPGPAR